MVSICLRDGRFKSVKTGGGYGDPATGRPELSEMFQEKRKVLHD